MVQPSHEVRACPVGLSNLYLHHHLNVTIDIVTITNIMCCIWEPLMPICERSRVRKPTPERLFTPIFTPTVHTLTYTVKSFGMWFMIALDVTNKVFTLIVSR